MHQSTTENIALWMVKIGLWIIPFLPLYVSSSMLFPFITGKNFAFRIIVEIIFTLWVGLAALRREYRPALTPLLKAATIFIVIVFLADLLSPNPYRAFFSNYERMEGFMMISHLYLYFVILASVFKTRRDWMIFFVSTIIASILVSLYALYQKLGYAVSLQGGFRVDSTIGNPTYLAAYLLFHVWLLVMLISQFWKKWWRVGALAAILIFELAIIYFTATRGVILALTLTAPLIAALVVIFYPRIFPAASGRGRMWGAVALFLFVLIPAFLWLARKTEFIRTNLVLERLTNYSFEGTVAARFKIWGMSWNGFLERPLFGWGQENYYLIFQKYFNPGLYAQEPWFDRSHNVFFDWLIHAGTFGLLAYLALFGAVFWMLARGARRGNIDWWQAMLLAGLFISYFLQNFFVFDNLNTYILFFGFLAYAAYAAEGEDATAQNKKPQRIFLLRGRAYGIAGFAFILMLSIAYFVNINGILESKALIAALQITQLAQQSPQGTVDHIIKAFRDALKYKTMGDTETREQLARVVLNVLETQKFSDEDKRRFIEFAIEEIKKEISIPARDVKHILMLASVLDAGAHLNTAWMAEAEQLLREAIRLSPSKQLIYFALAQLYLKTGNTDAALKTLYDAWKLDTSFTRAGANLLFVAIIAKRQDVADEVRRIVPFDAWDEGDLSRMAIAYRQIQDFSSALPVYARLVALSPQNAQYRLLYGALLVNFQKSNEAREHLEAAIRLDPKLETEARPILDAIGIQAK